MVTIIQIILNGHRNQKLMIKGKKINIIMVLNNTGENYLTEHKTNVEKGK